MIQLISKGFKQETINNNTDKNHSYDIIQSYSAPYFRGFRHRPVYLFFISEKGLQDKITHGFEGHVFKIIFLGYCGLGHIFLFTAASL